MVNSFQLGKSRYDQATFSGRLRHFLDIVDPTTLFTSEKRLAEAIHLLNDYKEGKIGPDVTDNKLWEAQKIKQTNVPTLYLIDWFSSSIHSSVVPTIAQTNVPALYLIDWFSSSIHSSVVPTIAQTNVPALYLIDWFSSSIHSSVVPTIAQAIIHPDTGEKILPPFRMSGFVPFGSIPVIGLLLPNQSFAQMIFWQWLNQSHNACVNYSNRNASKPTPTSRFIMGYTGAVTGAVTIAVSLSKLLRKAQNLKPVTKNLIERFIPFPAVATASVLNVILMRNHELSEGILVTTQDGEPLGNSKTAAKKAVFQTAITRVVLPAPVLLIPPLIMTQIEKMSFWSKYPRIRLPIHATVCTLMFALALPVAIAVFPQQSKILVSDIEADLQNKTTESYVYYNKGL